MAKIIVMRSEGSLIDRFRAYRVVIDGELRGEIKAKEEWSYTVAPGAHAISFGVGYYRSPPIKVVVENQTRLTCHSGVAHAFGLVPLVSPSSWITAREDNRPVEIPDPHPAAIAPSAVGEPELKAAGGWWARRIARRRAYGAIKLSSPKMDAGAKLRSSLELSLRAALASRAFKVCYEPQIDLASGRIVAFEALVRWQHPVHGDIAPNNFLPLAESLGLVSEIGHQVLHQAFACAAEWPHDISVAVNISDSQLAAEGAVPIVSAALADSGLRAERLILEISAESALSGAPQVVQAIDALRGMGVRAFINDFGASPASPQLLDAGRIDGVKINRSLISTIEDTGENYRRLQLVLAHCANHGLVCCAVGVESEPQRALLAQAHCAWAQGRLFGSTLNSTETSAVIERVNGDPMQVAPSSAKRAAAPSVVEGANEFVIVMTANVDAFGPEIVYVNPAFTRLTGYTLDDVAGDSPRLFYGPKTNPMTIDLMRAAVGKGVPVQAKLLCYNKSAEPHWFNVHLKPVCNKRGEVTHSVLLGAVMPVEKWEQETADPQTYRDPLTGLLNANGFLRALDAEIQYLKTASNPMTRPYHLYVTALELRDREEWETKLTAAQQAGLLFGVIDRLSSCLQPADKLAYVDKGRLVISLVRDNTAAIEALAELFSRIVGGMPLETAEGTISAEIAVGFAVYEPSDTPPVLTDRAVGAMFRAARAKALEKSAAVSEAA